MTSSFTFIQQLHSGKKSQYMLLKSLQNWGGYFFWAFSLILSEKFNAPNYISMHLRTHFQFQLSPPPPTHTPLKNLAYAIHYSQAVYSLKYQVHSENPVLRKPCKHNHSSENALWFGGVRKTLFYNHE